jgi:hypothetical protein
VAMLEYGSVDRIRFTCGRIDVNMLQNFLLEILEF